MSAVKRREDPTTPTVVGDVHESVLMEAHRITGGDRQAAYGSPKPNHDLMAAGFTLLLRDKLQPGAVVTAEDMARGMIWIKLARDVNKAKRDNAVDIAGYAWVLDNVREGEVLP